jgi:outer membrane receptor protein involved in Fe transport
MEGIIMELYKNRDADNFGLEAELMSPTLWNRVSGFLNFTAMRSRIQEDGQMKINTEFPEVILNGGIYYTKSRFDFNLYLKYVSKFESSRFVAQVPGEPTIYAPLGDYFTSDMTTGYTLGSKLAVKVYLKIQNLTDRRYSTVAGYPDFGRRFHLGARIIL